MLQCHSPRLLTFYPTTLYLSSARTRIQWMTQILNGSAAIANHGGTAGYATTVVGPSRLVAHLGPPVSTSGSAARAAGVAVPRMQKIGPRAACFVLIWRSYRHAQVSRSSVYKLLHVPTIGQARVLCSLTFPGRPTPCFTQICLYQPFSCWKQRIVLGQGQKQQA